VDMDMDMDMDGKFHIHGKPDNNRSRSFRVIQVPIESAYAISY